MRIIYHFAVEQYSTLNTKLINIVKVSVSVLSSTTYKTLILSYKLITKINFHIMVAMSVHCTVHGT